MARKGRPPGAAPPAGAALLQRAGPRNYSLRAAKAGRFRRLSRGPGYLCGVMTAATLPVLFANPAGQLAADPAGFMRMSWSAGPRTLADTQALLTQLAQALRQRGWGKVLADQTLMPSFSPTEQQWVAQEWLPAAVQHSGYRYGAIVVSSNTYARLATAFITTSVGRLPLRYRSFDSAAQASAWLATVA